MILLFFLYQIILFIYFWVIYGQQHLNNQKIHDSNSENVQRNILIISYVVFSFLICTIFISFHIVFLRRHEKNNEIHINFYTQNPKRFQNCIVLLTLFSSISIRDFIIRQIPENKIQIDIMILIVFSSAILFFIM